MPCAFCRSVGAAPAADTGGTPDLPATPNEDEQEAWLWDTLECFRRVRAHGARLLLRNVMIGCQPSPWQVQWLATSLAQQFPSGIVVLSLTQRQCVLFTARAAPQPLHIRCAINLLRLRLSLGLGIGRSGRTFALQVGRRQAPLARFLAAQPSGLEGGARA